MTFDFKISICGKTFDVDKFIESTELSLTNVRRIGEPINDRKNYNNSGCDIQIIEENQAIDSIGDYIQNFIIDNENVFEKLIEKYSADRITFIAHFYFNPAEELALTFGFSADFLATLAKYDIDTDFTVWDSTGFNEEV